MTGEKCKRLTVVPKEPVCLPIVCVQSPKPPSYCHPNSHTWAQSAQGKSQCLLGNLDIPFPRDLSKQRRCCPLSSVWFLSGHHHPTQRRTNAWTAHPPPHQPKPGLLVPLGKALIAERSPGPSTAPTAPTPATRLLLFVLATSPRVLLKAFTTLPGYTPGTPLTHPHLLPFSSGLDSEVSHTLQA